jgi:hypothetical protein
LHVNRKEGTITEEINGVKPLFNFLRNFLCANSAFSLVRRFGYASKIPFFKK